jgi:SNF2 family DNA or RNA helicase
LRTLHGTWIPDGLFIYMADFRQPLPIESWQRDVFDDRSFVQYGARPFGGQFMVPEFTPIGELKRPQPNPLPTKRIPGMLIPITNMLIFLVTVMSERSAAPKIRIADDFHYWQRASLFAMELLQRGRIAPSVQQVPGNKQTHTFAVWIPYLDNEMDKRRFLQLIESIPPFCCAYSPDDGRGWMGAAPRDIVLSFLTWGMDAWVRASVTKNQQHVALRIMEEAPQSETAQASSFSEAAMKWTFGLLEANGPKRFSVRAEDGNRLTKEVETWVVGAAGYKKYSQSHPDWETGSPGTNVGITALKKERANVHPGSRFRLCLRLEARDSEHWILHFLLQSVEDLSLVFAAEKIWSCTALPEALSDWEVAGLEDALLVELVRATRLYPLLARTLELPQPAELELDVKMAHQFLHKYVEVLQSGGIVVQLLAWWTQKGRHRIGMKLKVKQPTDEVNEAKMLDTSTESQVGLHQLVQFDMVVAVGDTELTYEELRELADQKATLVQIRGTWTEVDPDELQRVLGYLETSGQGELELGQFMRHAAEQHAKKRWAPGQDVVEVRTVDSDVIERRKSWSCSGKGKSLFQTKLPIVDVELPKHLENLLDGRVHLMDEPVPSGLHGELRPYQRQGFEWLSTMTRLGFGVCLADDMGLGKTVQIITLLLDNQKQVLASTEHLPLHSGVRPALVLCPTSLLGNWLREVARFAPSLQVYAYHGPNRPHGTEFLHYAGQADLVISTYNLVYRDFEDLSSIRWSHFILDEAQYIKNSESRQAQSAYKIRADRRIAMTGTPVENRLSELWSLFNFLNPGYLGAEKDFIRYFSVPIERDRNVEKTQVLQRLVTPFVLRRVKTDKSIISDLPEKIEMKNYCSLTREQASLYEAVVKDVLLRVQRATGIERRGIILAGLTKLKQVCNHPAQFLQDGSQLQGRSGKLNRLLELLVQVREVDEATLVFTQYREMGHLLVRAITEELEEEALFLHGGLNKYTRDSLVELFQSMAGPKIFVLSLKAGGVGLNLTRANHVIHYDRWWNPAVENQATDRAFRIGQQRNVEVHKFICQGTLEDKIDALMESKQALAQGIIGNSEAWLSELSNAELESVLELRRSALQEEEAS